MSTLSIFDAFGVTSPNTDTKQIPLSAVCSTGKGTNRDKMKFRFEYKNLRRILRNINQGTPIWAWGPSGCGKTELYQQIGVRLDRPVHVISFGEETSLRELLGTFAIHSTPAADLSQSEEKGLGGVAKALWALAKRGLGMQTEFRYGQLPLAIQEEGAIIVLDEFNMAPAGVAAQLNRFLETGELTIPETGEAIKMAKDAVLVVTSNTAGGVDEAGLFAGSQQQNGATRSRFAYIKLDYLPEDEERLMLLDHVEGADAIKTPGDKTFSTLAVDLGRSCRALVEQGQVSLPFTARNLIRFARATKELRDIADGFRDAYYDGLSASEQVSVGQVFHKVFGIKLEQDKGAK